MHVHLGWHKRSLRRHSLELPRKFPLGILTLVILVSILAVPSVTALGRIAVSIDAAHFDGTQKSEMGVNALLLKAQGPISTASFSGAAQSVHIRTYNYTTDGIHLGTTVGLEPERSGTTYDIAQAQFHAGGTPGPELFVSPLDSLPLPEMEWTSLDLSLAPSSIARVSETPNVQTNRPVLSADVNELLSVQTNSANRFRIEGSFALSLWFWNFTIGNNEGSRVVTTGAFQEDLSASPVPTFGVAYTEFAQVAQLEIRHGWMEFSNVDGAHLQTFGSQIDVNGSGKVSLDGASTLSVDKSGLTLREAAVNVAGSYQLSVHRASEMAAELHSLIGTIDVNGTPIKLGDSGPLRSTTTTSNPRGTVTWAWPFAIIGIIGMAVLVKGPALTSRFNRIQVRFEQHDYLGVLNRIESFTQRPRYARRASFLKAVSLLSLNEFKEASLYLQTLAPHKAPEPATKAFLQACAAAGLGQDSTAISHLSECFKNDPSYIEEAKTVPALVGYLPYFSLSPTEAAT